MLIRGEVLIQEVTIWEDDCICRVGIWLVGQGWPLAGQNGQKIFGRGQNANPGLKDFSIYYVNNYYCKILFELHCSSNDIFNSFAHTIIK